MRIAQDTDKLLCPHRDGSSASGKDSTQKKSTVADVLSRAVEVYISAKGKSLNESTDMEDDLTPAELALAADEKERAALAAAQPDDRTARTALRAYQKTAAAKKHTDLSAIVVPTNKNTSDT